MAGHGKPLGPERHDNISHMLRTVVGTFLSCSSYLVAEDVVGEAIEKLTEKSAELLLATS